MANIFKCKCTLGTISQNIICLTLGLLIGIKLTAFFYAVQNDAVASDEDDFELASHLSIPEEYEMLPQYLFNSTRVLCWIMTKPSDHLNKAIHIRNTWGQRCNKLLFISSADDDELQTVKLDVQEGRDNLWNKTKEALKYIYDHHYNDAEWFLKADDDTYVIMENLRYLLYPYSSATPIYFGAKFKPLVNQGYMSGGAGYVLSKEALKKFTLEAYDNNRTCPKTFTSEDVQLGYCLEKINVTAGDSRDCEGKERFVPLAVEHLIPTDLSSWYKNYSYYTQNRNCCSSSGISFHYIKPYQFYIMDYLIYSLRAIGVWGNLTESLPDRFNGSAILG